MAEPLKYMYNNSFFTTFTRSVKKVLPGFQEKKFMREVMDADWENKELKQRMRHIAVILKDHLPSNYAESIRVIGKIIQELRQQRVKEQSFEYMFLPDYVELYGQHDFKTSMLAFETITQFTSCEYGIRPFLIQDQAATMQQMLIWSKHPHASVRRFSSEGCRPMLPWAMAIPSLKKDPGSILPILENLQQDPSEYVRKSVANNLNDISKNHPQVVLQLVKKWKGKNPSTDWIIKHGCRTLLKKGDPKALALFGLSNQVQCQIKNFQLSGTEIKLGKSLQFSFTLVHHEKNTMPLRIEYYVHYLKKNGQHTKKIFKITENTYQPGKAYDFSKSQLFKDLTTRKHYAGEHKISMVVNGIEFAPLSFHLKA